MEVEAKTFSWSFSQWETYQSCPRRWKYQSVDKLPRQPPGPAAARGLEIHKTIEDYIGWRAEEPHPAVKSSYLSIFDDFRNHPNGERHCELKLQFDEDWNLAGGAFGVKPVWLRAVLDAVRVGGPWTVGKVEGEPQIAYVGEWKSGKPKETHRDQRHLYALITMLKWPWVDEVQVTTHYVEGTAPSERLVAKGSAVPKMKTVWMERVSLMQRDKILAPRPGYHCNWCDFSKRKGGPCEFGS